MPKEEKGVNPLLAKRKREEKIAKSASEIAGAFQQSQSVRKEVRTPQAAAQDDFDAQIKKEAKKVSKEKRYQKTIYVEESLLNVLETEVSARMIRVLKMKPDQRKNQTLKGAFNDVVNEAIKAGLEKGGLSWSRK